MTQNMRFCAKKQGDTLLIMSFSEDFTANSYKCASFFDGYRVVVGHAHGDFLEIGALLEVLSLEGVEEAGECLEFIADLGFVVGIGSHAHDSGYLYMVQ